VLRAVTIFMDVILYLLQSEKASRMNRILRDNKYHPIIISWKRKEAQENAFRRRINGQPETFYNFMKEEFVKTHRVYIAKIASALNMEQLAKVFLKPSNEYS
jgi:hypothetical protein